ncbi:MAG: helix-turn-helix domain-containing protein [Myxococcota bacterium]
MTDYLAQVQAGIDYVEARLDRRIALADVARAGGMSQWHFQRIFRSLTGETLKTYIRARRLSTAQEQLRTTDLRILDIALEAGFASQEAFARAFKQAFGSTPRVFRREGCGGRFPKKLQIDEAYLRHLQANVSLAPTIGRQPARWVVGLGTRFYGVDSDKNNLGATLPALWGAFLPRLGEVRGGRAGVCFGVVIPTATDRLDYVAGIEVPGPGAAPPGMVAVRVPEATWASFTHAGPAQQVDRTVSYAYGTWLPRSGRRHTGGPDLEVYGASYHPTSPDSRLDYAVPVG